MKNKILIFMMLTSMLLTSCNKTKEDTTTQATPSNPNSATEAVQVPMPEFIEPEIPVEMPLEIPLEMPLDVTEIDPETEENPETDEITETEENAGVEVDTDETATEEVVETATSSTPSSTATSSTPSSTATSSTTTSTATSSTTTSTATSSATTSTATSSTTTSTPTSSATSSTVTSSATSSTATSSATTSTTTSTTTASSSQTINSYVDFYIVDMSGNAVSGVTTDFDLNTTNTTSAVTDSTGKTRVQLYSTDMGKAFSSEISLTHNQAFKANVTILDSTNVNKNISHIENSEYSVLTKLNTATVDASSSTTIVNNQVITIIIMLDYANAGTSTSTNTSTSTSGNTSSSSEVDINAYLNLDLANMSYAYDYYNEPWNYSRDYNDVKVEVELLTKDKQTSKMVTIYDGDGYGGRYTFKESDAELLIGSLIAITAHHQFEVEVEFDDVLWREDRARAQSAAIGNGMHAVYLHDIIDETVNYGKDFYLYVLMDNKS